MVGLRTVTDCMKSQLIKKKTNKQIALIMNRVNAFSAILTRFLPVLDGVSMLLNSQVTNYLGNSKTVEIGHVHFPKVKSITYNLRTLIAVKVLLSTGLVLGAIYVEVGDPR